MSLALAPDQTRAETRARWASTLTLESPAPSEWGPIVWQWMHQHPDLNFDDGSATTQDVWLAGLAAEAAEGERTWGARSDGRPIGFLGMRPLSPRVWMSRGLCFCRSVHGTGLPHLATARALAEVFALGAEKVCAPYYAHNVRVGAFLRGLGAVEEGCLRGQVTQHGRPVDLKLVAIFAPGKG